MHGHSVGVVGHKRAARTALLCTRRKHEVLHHELVAAVEQFRERLPAIGPLEGVLLAHAHPGHLPAQTRHIVAAPCQVFLSGEQIPPRLKPLVA